MISFSDTEIIKWLLKMFNLILCVCASVYRIKFTFNLIVSFQTDTKRERPGTWRQRLELIQPQSRTAWIQ